VVDGTAWGAIGVIDYKWYEVAKYQLRPQFGQNVKILLINLDYWNKLPKDLQDLIAQVTKEMEEDGYKTLTRELEVQEKQLVSLSS
jgi:TRAP-type C4-dicarboxylate transport system substrate-binding protein